MLVNKVEVGAGFPDVPVELVVLTLLTTITGDGAVPYLVEEVGNVELYLVDVYFLLAVVVKVVVAFNLLLDVVDVVVLDKLVLLNLVVVDDLFLNVLHVVDVLLNVIVPFFSADVVVKDIVLEHFCQQIFVEQLIVVNVVLDAVLPIVLLDAEHVVVVELCKIHSLDVMSCCARCCCRSRFPYLVVELLVEIIVADDVDFAYVLLDVEDTLGVERLIVHSLAVRSRCAKPLSQLSCLILNLMSLPSCCCC